MRSKNSDLHKSVRCIGRTRSLQQTLLQTIVIDPILCGVSAHCVCHRFQLFRGIRHCHTRPDGLQHFHVVVAVPEGNRFRRLQAVLLQQPFDRASLSAVCRDDIDRPVPLRCNFCAADPLHHPRILRLAASHHHLINFFLPQRIKVGRNFHGKPCDPEIVR